MVGSGKGKRLTPENRGVVRGSGQTDKARKATGGPSSLFVGVTLGTDIFTWPVSSVPRPAIRQP